MLNYIWLGIVLASIFFGVLNGQLQAVAMAVTDSAKHAIEIAIGLLGIMCFWLGLLQIAEDAGLTQKFARMIYPIMRRLFPDVPADHPAMGAMTMNIAANMLGLNNAATPVGLRAMEALEKLNPLPGTATNAMCTFLAINTSSVQLIPTTQIAYLVAAGSTHPTDIIITSLLATSCSTIAAIIAVKFCEKLPYFAVKKEIENGYTELNQ